jgi:serine/threonine protein kinase
MNNGQEFASDRRDRRAKSAPAHLFQTPTKHTPGGTSHTPVQFSDGDFQLDLIVPRHLCLARDQLVLGKTLGGGATAVVKEGMFGPATPVAIKLVPLYHFHFEAQQSNNKIAREIQLLSQIHHPHCTSFYGISHDEAWLMLVIELCWGGNLRNVMEQRPEVVIRRSSSFMLHIASGIAYLHSQDIIHRDIKAENCLLSTLDYETAVAKICDFGLSRGVPNAQTDATLTSGVGTLRYLAPELLGNPQYESLDMDTVHNEQQLQINGSRSDCYSAAILFAELLCADRDIFQGRTNLEILRSVVIDKYVAYYAVPHVFCTPPSLALDLVSPERPTIRFHRVAVLCCTY